jgi:polyhydroxyalkanoate synthase subunit PhaC
MNLVTGFQNFLEDWERKISGKKPAGAEQFVVGRDVASRRARWSTATG